MTRIHVRPHPVKPSASRRRRTTALVTGGLLTSLVAASVATAGVIAPAGAAPASGSTLTPPSSKQISDKYHRTIDIRRLPPGQSPSIPWITNSTIHDGGETIALGIEPESFVELSDGYALRSPLSEEPGSWRLDFVRTNGEITPLDRGQVSAPSARADHERFIWTSAETDPDGSRVVSFYAGLGNGVIDNPGDYGSVTDSDLTPIGFVNDSYGFLLDPEGGTDTAQAWDPETSAHVWFNNNLGVTAVSESGGYASFVRRFDDEERPCTTTARFNDGEHTDLWESCELYPISFSPDGRYAVAIDSRTDGLGAGELIVVNPVTGERRISLDVELNQQVAWEPDGSLVFDAWNDNMVALVRCSVA